MRINHLIRAGLVWICQMCSFPNLGGSYCIRCKAHKPQ